MYLIINADDFGLSKAVNYGIIEAHKNGVVTSTTAMVNGYAFEDCLLLSEQSPLLSIGIHLNITMFKALSGISSLTNEEGILLPKENYISPFKINEVELENELRLQMEHFIKVMKRKPSHIDSHHHIHLLPEIKPVVMKIAEEYGLMVRDYNGIAFDDSFYGRDIDHSFFEDYYYSGCIELMVHPSFVDDYLMKATSYNLDRLNEYEILTSPIIKEYLTKNKVKLVSYLDEEVCQCY